MIDVILILVLVLIIALAAGYVYRAKKSGKTCIGCPNSGHCASSCGCGCKSSPKNDTKE